jgi:hypothetical protein
MENSEPSANEPQSASNDVLRLELQQAIELIRHLISLFVQAAGFFIAADALLLGYGIGQRRALYLLFACLSVVGMAVTLWLLLGASVTPSYVAIRLERKLLGPNEVTLVDFVVRFRNRLLYERLIQADDADTSFEERERLIRQGLPFRDFVKGATLYGLGAMLLAQIAFFVLSLTTLGYSFT